MRTVALGFVVAAIAACAGCGATAQPVGHPGGGATLSSVSSPPTAGHNRSATEADLKRLLAMAPIPVGAKAVSGPQRALDGPAMGTPSTSSLIDLHGFWHVSMPMSTVWSFVRAHAPHGLTGSGSSSGNNGFGATEGIAWGEPNTSYAENMQLEVSVVANDGGTLIRADGIGEWLDPRPMLDAAKGARLRVTVAGGCPSSRGDTVGVSSPGPGLDGALLPAGDPTSALICEYGGVNSSPVSGLVDRVVVAASGAERIAAEARKLPVSHEDDVTTSCPADDGSYDVIALHFAGRPDVDLGDGATGCQSVANGHIVVNGGLNLRPWIKPRPAL